MDNYVLIWWWWQVPTTWWAKDPLDDADFIPNVRSAVLNWSNTVTGVPQLTYIESTAEATADIRFYSQICPFDYDAAGCFSAFDWETRTPTNGYGENASYIKKAALYIRPSDPPNASCPCFRWKLPEGRVGTIAHEMGHLVGLHEQYVEANGNCWDYNRSVMDAVKDDAAGLKIHCDEVQGPTPFDVQRVNAYWGEGDLAVMGFGLGPVAYYSWKDLAWTEHAHGLGFWWLNEATNQWQEYYNMPMKTDIGVHLFTKDLIWSKQIDWRDYQAQGAQAGWHTMCGSPYFPAYHQWGSYRCSPVIQLSAQ
ncbi:MAG: hypothetical protein HY671_03215 [Chloroflexi bacterium]|nr:hypothetical protein [Chloroflexota bacterium]